MANKEIFHVDVTSTKSDYVFYYNMVSAVNEKVIETLRKEIPDRLITPAAREYVNNVRNGQFIHKQGPGEFGVMAKWDPHTDSFEYFMADEMRGICATVSANLAIEIINKAIKYCPKDTGFLASSFRIEDLGDGRCTIYNDCPYAWYVEEFTWKKHKWPTRAKFLTTAVWEVGQKYGLWA